MSYYHEVPYYVEVGLQAIAEAILEKSEDPYDRALTSNSGSDEYVSKVFAMRTFCWCDGDVTGHDFGCPPNFHYFKSDLQVEWYKHSQRSAYLNRRTTSSEWQDILLDCLHDVRDSNRR